MLSYHISPPPPLPPPSLPGFSVKTSLRPAGSLLQMEPWSAMRSRGGGALRVAGGAALGELRS